MAISVSTYVPLDQLRKPGIAFRSAWSEKSEEKRRDMIIKKFYSFPRRLTVGGMPKRCGLVEARRLSGCAIVSGTSQKLSERSRHEGVLFLHKKGLNIARVSFLPIVPRNVSG